VAVLILFGSAARPWLKTHVLLAAAGMLAFVLLFVLVPGLGDAGADGGARTGLSRDLTSASHRLRLWSDSLALIRGAPLLGIGPMHFVCEQVHRPRFGGSPHNIVLQIATEWGLPAAILFLFLAVWAAIGWTRWARGEARRGHDPAILVGLSASLYAAAAHSMVSSLFNTPMSQMMLVVLAGWTLRLHSGSVQRHPPAPNQGRLATATLAAVVLTVVTVLVWGIGSVNTAHARLVESWTNGGGSIIPRLWLHGSICEDP
jgi:O-antigen ligase